MPEPIPPEKEVIDVPPEDAPRAVQRVEPRPADRVSSGEGRKDHNVIIGSLTINQAPMERYVTAPLRRRYHRHYHPRHKHGTKHLIADILLALTVVALIGVNIYAFFFSVPGLQEKVVMTLGVTPETIQSGEQTTITVDYENRSDTALLDAALSILCPCNVTPVTAEPSDIYDAKTHTFRIGTIEPHGNGSVRFSWVYLGTVGTTQHFSAALSYGTKNATRRETKSVLWRAPVNTSALALTIDTPPEFIHEGRMPFTLRYVNRGTRPLASVRIEPLLPPNAQLLDTNPRITDGAFTLPVLPPGVEGALQGRFAFRGSGETETTFSVRTYLGEARILQEEVQHRATVFYPKFTITPLHEVGRDALVVGSPAAFTFAYENKEDDDVLDVALTLDPPTSLFTTAKDSVVAHTRQDDPSLALVRKGTKGTLLFTVNTKTEIDRKEVFGDGDPVVHLPYTIRYRRASAPDREIRIDRVDDWKVQSDLLMHAFGRYYTPEGDQIGRGPLPPRVDESTRYWIFISLTNTVSDVADVIATAVLGPQVDWTRKSSVTLGDPLQFDERTRTLTWRLPKLTKFSGGAYPDVGMAVEVALTPDMASVDTTPALLTDIRARGRDTFTNTTVEKSASSVTTLLTVDQRARDKGKVVR